MEIPQDSMDVLIGSCGYSGIAFRFQTPAIEELRYLEL